MKIRQGFVSNSSSSSFIVLLPSNFDSDKFVDNLPEDFTNVFDDPYEDTNVDKDFIKSVLKKFQEKKGFWNEDSWLEVEICTETLKDYIISTVEGGPEDGTISLVSDSDKEKIKRILNEN